MKLKPSDEEVIPMYWNKYINKATAKTWNGKEYVVPSDEEQKAYKNIKETTATKKLSGWKKQKRKVVKKKELLKASVKKDIKKKGKK